MGVIHHTTKKFSKMEIRRDKYGNQILTGSDLLAYNGFKDTPGDSSVSTPPAQTAGRCDTSTDIETLTNRVRNIVEGNTEAPIIVCAVIELLFLNGCRISEAIDVTGSNITADGKVVSSAKKGGHQRILVTANYQRYWQAKRGMKERVSDVYDRFWFYRQFKKYGIYMNAPHSTKKAVTHALRHLYVQNTQSVIISDETVSREVGHRYKKSLKHYKREKNGK